MNSNLKEMKVEVPIVCLDGRTSRYERRQIKVAIAKLLSKQNLIKTLKELAIYWRRRVGRRQVPWLLRSCLGYEAVWPSCVIVTPGRV